MQRVVKLLNLRLDVRSEPGKGSVFSLVLPASHGPTAAVCPDSMRPVLHERPAGRPRILLVEDDPAVRDATRMLLKVEGYRVTAVGSLDEALRKAREAEAIDLLITDYHLSNGETGIQVIASLRETFDKNLKAVLITGDTSSAIRVLPRDPHLRLASKPVRSDELLTLLEELLVA